jgi:heat shock protein HtpX
MNNLKTVALLAFMSALVWGVAYTWGGANGFWIGLVLAVGINFVAYFFSDKIALKSTRAKPVEEHELPEVYSIVRNLASKARMPMPRIYLIDSPQPNAFATGRNPEHAAVAVTTGILQALDRDELEGVLGHELSHVQNRDILISSVAAMLAAALSIFSRMAFFFGGGRDRNNPVGAIIGLVAIIVAPIAAILIRMAISRTREFQADASGAELTGRPQMLASALQKIAAGTARRPMNVNPAVSQLFIENPMKAARGRNMANLFSTHPPMEERVRRLMSMASGIR